MAKLDYCARCGAAAIMRNNGKGHSTYILYKACCADNPNHTTKAFHKARNAAAVWNEMQKQIRERSERCLTGSTSEN